MILMLLFNVICIMLFRCGILMSDLNVVLYMVIFYVVYLCWFRNVVFICWFFMLFLNGIYVMSFSFGYFMLDIYVALIMLNYYVIF